MKIIIINWLFLLPIFAFSQPILTNFQKERAKTQLESRIYSPTDRGTIVSTYSDLRLKSDLGDKSASATLGFSLGQTSISTYFEQPFQEQPKKVTFFNQDGLQSGTAFKISFQHTFWHPKMDFNNFDRVRNDFANRKSIINDTLRREITLSDLDDTAYNRVVESMNFGVPILIGIAYGGAKNELDYISDSSSINPMNVVKFNQNIQISLGFILSKSVVIGISYTREIKFNGADKTSIFNFPRTGSNLSYEKEVGVGSPVRKDDNKFQFEYRKLFIKKGQGPSLAINPRLFYLTSKKTLNFELPIYFLRQSEDGKLKGLQGGFSIGYSSKINKSTSFQQGFASSIFVSAPFDLFNLFRTK